MRARGARIERVVERRHDRADHPAAVAAQRAGRAVRHVAQLGDGIAHPPPGLGVDLVGRVEHARHGGGRYAGKPRDVLGARAAAALRRTVCGRGRHRRAAIVVVMVECDCSNSTTWALVATRHAYPRCACASGQVADTVNVIEYMDDRANRPMGAACATQESQRLEESHDEALAADAPSPVSSRRECCARRRARHRRRAGPAVRRLQRVRAGRRPRARTVRPRSTGARPRASRSPSR